MMAASKVSNLPNTPAHLIREKIQTLCKEGKELIVKDDINKALKLFKKAFILSCNISNESIHKTCLFNLGAAYICVGKPKKALKCFVKSKIYGKKDEGDGDLYFNIAAAYDKMQEYDKAVKFYEKAINQYSSEEINSIADALIKLGYCFASVGELSSAAHSFRLAGHSYLKNERLEDAAMAMREATKYMINSQEFPKTEVLQTLNICIESFKGVSNKQILGDPLRQCYVNEGLGATYFCLGNMEQAINYYKKALTLSGGIQETSDTIRDRILQKLTDVIEYKAAHQPTVTTSKSVSRKKSNQSPSNCANDDCKSVISQYHESCLNSDITTSDSSDDEHLLQRSLRHSDDRLPVPKFKQPKTNEQDISENESKHQRRTQTQVSESKSSTTPREDEEESKQECIDPQNGAKSVKINKNYTSDTENDSEYQFRDQGNFSPVVRIGSSELQRKRYNT
ncbi:tetratricopeptide repeat protein 24-like [Pyxicephalus adspersus]|uniref:tetratricopeptide repeat protein 24-like n=1 Tax=Pyxicephalus adspersus TaxID=30357 RepID=UPI003B5A2DDC